MSSSIFILNAKKILGVPIVGTFDTDKVLVYDKYTNTIQFINSNEIETKVPITVVANYSVLPSASTVSGKFYWCSASQGTEWLPGSLGGTYYSNGLYYSNGITWQYLIVPYQATQSEVDAGTVTDKFVTPKTLNDAIKWTTKEPANSNIQSHISNTVIHVTSGDKSTWSGKQDSLGFTPENSSNKQNSLNLDGNGIKFPTVDAVNSGLSGKQNLGNYATGTGSANGTNTGDETINTLASKTNAGTAKNTLVDNDELLISDSEDSYKGKKILWSVIKSTLKPYFDTIYQAILTATNFGTFLFGLTAKDTIVDSDIVSSSDSADTNKAKKTSWLNIWINYIKVKADLVYQTILNSTNLGALINGLTEKTTIVDADSLLISDSADTNKAKKTLWSTIKTVLSSTLVPFTLITKAKGLTGFVDPSSVIVTGNATNRTIALSGTVEDLWCGVTVASLNNTFVSGAHGTNTALKYYLYYNGSITDWYTTVWSFDMLMIAYAEYDTVGATWHYYREPHGLMDYLAHQNDHLNIGTSKNSGLTFVNGSYTLSSTTAANRRPDVSAGVVLDEDLPSTVATLTSKNYCQFRLGTVFSKTFNVDQGDIVALSTNNPYYNLLTSTDGAQTLMPSNSVATIWVYAQPMCADATSQKYRLLFVQPQWVTQSAGSLAGQLATAVSAELLRNSSELNLGDLINSEIVCIGKILITYTASNWYLSSVINLSGNKLGQVGSATGNYLNAVNTDTTLTGNGTSGVPLSVASAPKLTTARNINGVSFDGTANITINAYPTGFSDFAAGTGNLGSSAGGNTAFSVSFGKTFSGVPNLSTTFINTSTSDRFITCTYNVTSTGFTYYVYRQDSAGGSWGQIPQVGWHSSRP